MLRVLAVLLAIGLMAIPVAVHGDETEVTVLATPMHPPTVVSSNATDITGTTARVHGNMTDTGGQDAHTVGFEWGFASGNYTEDWSAVGSFEAGAFTRVISGLPGNTEVFWRAFAENDAGRSHSIERSFVTLAVLDPPTDFTITQIGPNSLNITWTPGPGATSIIIRVSEDGYPATVTDGYLVYSGNSTFVVVDGLSLSTVIYYFRAWSYNDIDYSVGYAQASAGSLSGLEAVLAFLIPLIDGPTGIVNMMFAVALMGFGFWKKGWLRVLFATSLIIWGAATMPHDIKIAAPFVGVGTLLFFMAIFQLVTSYRESRKEATWAN